MKLGDSHSSCRCRTLIIEEVITMANEANEANELINAMSNEDLQAYKDKYPDNQSLVTLIDGVFATRLAGEVKAKLEATFTKEVDKLVKKLVFPPDIHNIYIAPQEVEEPDTTQEAEMVEVTDESGEVHQEQRYPMVKTLKNVVTPNKGFAVKASDNGNGKSTSNKRAITIERREGNTLVLVGNFPSGQAGADFLKVPTGVSSANKVLRDEGYIVSPYTGTDYTT